MKKKSENSACIAVTIYTLVYILSLALRSLPMLAVATAFFAYVLYTSWERERVERRLRNLNKGLSQQAREALRESEEER